MNTRITTYPYNPFPWKFIHFDLNKILIIIHVIQNDFQMKFESNKSIHYSQCLENSARSYQSCLLLFKRKSHTLYVFCYKTTVSLI